MLKDVIGIVIKERDYGESSKILDVFTKEYGIIGIISKGSKKLKSSLNGVSSKLSYGTFHIYYKENKLSTLVSIDIINPFINIKKDIFRLSITSYLFELTYQVIKQSNEYNQIFDYFIGGLLKMDEGYNPFAIMNILELKYLYFLGVGPVLDYCSICGSKTDIITLSYNYEGLLCKKCSGNEKVYDIKTIKYVRMFYYLDISKITKIKIDENIVNDIDDFLNEYYKKHTGLYLNSKNFIYDLKKIN